MQLETLYQEIILDHYRNPHHRACATPYDAEVHHVNPTCGDEVTVRVRIDGRRRRRRLLRRPGVFDQPGQRVGDDRAGASGGPSTRRSRCSEEFLALMQGRGEVEPDEERLEDAVAFAGVAKFPARVKCALLGWMAFKDAALRATAQEVAP